MYGELVEAELSVTHSKSSLKTFFSVTLDTHDAAKMLEVNLNQDLL